MPGTEENPGNRTLRRRGAVLLAGVLLLSACGSDDASPVGDRSSTDNEAAATTEATAPAPDSTTTATSDPTASVEPQYELVGELDLSPAELNAMLAFVEDAAGRQFLRPPRVVVQSVEEFEAGLAPTAEQEAAAREGAEQSARYLQAIGHTTLGVDELFDALHELGSSTDLISGRYDPETDEVYIPEGALVGDQFNAILVHELAHALDGQHVDLQAAIETLEEMAAADDLGDAGFSIRATVEGRATWVQTRWMIVNNVIPEAGEIPESYSTVPASVINSFVLPYQLGAQTIDGLGGASATWDLFENYPTTSEQMIFADRIGSDLPVEVAVPTHEGEIFSQGILGAEGILLLTLGNTLTPSQTDVMSALAAAEGWGGDRFVVAGDDTKSCLYASIVADTPADLAELEVVFTDWAATESVEGAERSAIVDSETLAVTACAPFIP